MVVVGRQRVGKTSFLNALAQYLQERGAEFAIWDTDQMNTTNNMSVFHAEASSPASERREDVKAWLEARFLDECARGDDLANIGRDTGAFDAIDAGRVIEHRRHAACGRERQQQA